VNDTVAMWDRGRRCGPESCLSDLALDRLGLPECTAEERERAQAHLATCRACAQAAAALDGDRNRFLTEADVPALARDALARAERAPDRGAWQRWLAPVLGLGLAAAGLMFWLRPGDRAGLPAGGDGLSAKGSFAVELYVKHAERGGEGRLHLGETLHPGDHVRLRLTGGAAYAAVLAVDTTGRVSVYHPAGGAQAAAAEPGELPVRGAIELDETLGTEVLLAFSCAQPVDVATLVAAVQQATDRARVAHDPADAVGSMKVPCDISRYRIQKGTSPPQPGRPGWGPRSGGAR
jgi:hypothetical protein